VTVLCSTTTVLADPPSGRDCGGCRTGAPASHLSNLTQVSQSSSHPGLAEGQGPWPQLARAVYPFFAGTPVDQHPAAGEMNRSTPPVSARDRTFGPWPNDAQLQELTYDPPGHGPTAGPGAWLLGGGSCRPQWPARWRWPEYPLRRGGLQTSESDYPKLTTLSGCPDYLSGHPAPPEAWAFATYDHTANSKGEGAFQDLTYLATSRAQAPCLNSLTRSSPTW
jgi:hypothetical protein